MSRPCMESRQVFHRKNKEMSFTCHEMLVRLACDQHDKWISLDLYVHSNFSSTTSPNLLVSFHAWCTLDLLHLDVEVNPSSVKKRDQQVFLADRSRETLGCKQRLPLTPKYRVVLFVHSNEHFEGLRLLSDSMSSVCSS